MNHSLLEYVIAEMVTPSANNRMKRKRIEKQTQTQTQAHCREEEEQEQEQYVNENANSNNGVVAMLHSPQDHNVRSRAVFILENASLQKGLVKKVIFHPNNHNLVASPLNAWF